MNGGTKFFLFIQSTLQIKNLSKSYGNLMAVKGVDPDIPEGILGAMTAGFCFLFQWD